jgi:hypothetical protein
MDRINIIKHIKNNSPQYPLNIGYDGKYTEESGNKIFLGLQTDNRLKWHNTTEQIIPKLCAACHVAESMVHISNTGTLKITYFAYLHFIMQYGIIHGGNSSYSNKKVTIQNRNVRIMVHAKHTNTHRGLCGRTEILPLPCEYIFSLITSMKITEQFFKQIQLYITII